MKSIPLTVNTNWLLDPPRNLHILILLFASFKIVVKKRKLTFVMFTKWQNAHLRGKKKRYSIRTVIKKNRNPWMINMRMFRPVMSQLNGSRTRFCPDKKQTDKETWKQGKSAYKSNGLSAGAYPGSNYSNTPPPPPMDAHLPQSSPPPPFHPPAFNSLWGTVRVKCLPTNTTRCPGQGLNLDRSIWSPAH